MYNHNIFKKQGCFWIFSHISIWSILELVYEQTQSDKWVSGHIYDGILMMRVATCKCRKNSSYYNDDGERK